MTSFQDKRRLVLNTLGVIGWCALWFLAGYGLGALLR